MPIALIVSRRPANGSRPAFVTMANSESAGSSEAKTIGQKPYRHSTNLTGTQRIDRPHQRRDATSESPSVATPLDVELDAEQIRRQADQLAAHLRTRQKELDARESELNSRIAKWESDARTSRLLLAERESDWAACGEQLARQQQELAAQCEAIANRQQEVAAREQAVSKQEQEVERRLARLAAAEAARQKQAAATIMRQDPEQLRMAESLAARERQLNESEARLVEAQAETKKLRKQLLSHQRALDEEAAATRQRMALEHRQATADLQQQRQAVQRRADHVDHSRAALRQLRGELECMHRETLEIRLATEELWAQISGAAPSAAITQSLGRIRAKLAEQHQQANAEIADRKKELEAIRGQLARQHTTLVEQKRRFDLWADGCREECQQQASRLVARQQQLHHDERRFEEQSHRWQAERMEYQQEIRRLRAKLAERDAIRVPA